MSPASANGSTPHDAAPCTHPWAFAVQPFRMAGNFYYVGNSSVSAHLIDTGEGLILLDTAYPQTVYLLLESIRFAGIHPDQSETLERAAARTDDHNPLIDPTAWPRFLVEMETRFREAFD